jgi:hypothetical protein
MSHCIIQRLLSLAAAGKSPHRASIAHSVHDHRKFQHA